mgnify:CR=1 FL=1
MNDFGNFPEVVSKLISACKNLRLVRKTRLFTGSGSIAVNGDRSEFPARLWDVSVALDAFKSEETLREHFMIPDIISEAFLMWLQENGIDDSEPRAIISYCKTGKMPRNENSLTPPDVCQAGILRLIRESEARVKALGPVAPKRFTVRRNTPENVSGSGPSRAPYT